MSSTLPRVYLDYAAATPLDPEVRAAMEPYWSGVFANPHSVHTPGREARRAVIEARTAIAGYLRVPPSDIHFTYGGTDANARALYGVVHALLDRGLRHEDLHVVISAIEHSSVRECAEGLARRGVGLSLAPVTAEGIVDLKGFEAALRPNTVFASVMLANNEVGTIQPIREIARVIERLRKENFQIPVLHCDASQALFMLPVRADELRADMITLDAQKIYGPKGVGVLYANRSVPYVSLYGTSHGRDTSGTPNTPGIVGFAEAFRITEERREEDARRIIELRDYFFEEILKKVPTAHINGSREHRIANNVNVSFPGVESEFLVAQLDHKGIACSATSACLAEASGGSHVVRALDPEYADSAVRFTLGRETTREEIDCTIKTLCFVSSC